MPRRPPPNPLVSLIDTFLDAAEDSLYNLFGNLLTAQPQSSPPPPGPTHKRSRKPPSNPPTPHHPTPRPSTPPRPSKPPSTPFPDHYATLNLHPKAHPAVIRAAYTSLARQYHPDLHHLTGSKSNKESEEKMRRINLAYEVLKDPARRQAYDFERRKRGL